MKANILTPGLVFAIDCLLADRNFDAAKFLATTCGISTRDAADRAVIQSMKAEASISPRTIAFIKQHEAKPTPAARRKAVKG